MGEVGYIKSGCVMDSVSMGSCGMDNDDLGTGWHGCYGRVTD